MLNYVPQENCILETLQQSYIPHCNYVFFNFLFAHDQICTPPTGYTGSFIYIYVMVWRNGSVCSKLTYLGTLVHKGISSQVLVTALGPPLPLYFLEHYEGSNTS